MYIEPWVDLFPSQMSQKRNIQKNNVTKINRMCVTTDINTVTWQQPSFRIYAFYAILCGNVHTQLLRKPSTSWLQQQNIKHANPQFQIVKPDILNGIYIDVCEIHQHKKPKHQTRQNVV